MKHKYYAVRQGRQIGIFSSWQECQRQIIKYSGAEYKSFRTKEEADAYLAGDQPRQMPPTISFPDDESVTDIWVDGSCMPQPDGSLRIGWAFLVMRGGQEIHRERGNDIPPDAHQHRNVAGEIMAVLKAVQWCQTQHITSIRIYHDYQGLASWPTRAWEAHTSFTQKYADTVRTSGIAIQWVKVAAHSGNPQNDIVDQEAKKATQEPPTMQ